MHTCRARSENDVYEWIVNTTTEQGFSNINLCYYSSINVLLGDPVTHNISVPICDVTIVCSIETKYMCSFRS